MPLLTEVPVHAFEHLLRLNRVNNQAFFLNEFSHIFKNPLNSIQLASDLLKSYTQDINARFDELSDQITDLPICHPDLAPIQSVLADMPQVIQGISDSAFRLNLLVSWLSEFTGRGAVARSHEVDLNGLISLCATMAEHQISLHTDSFTLDLEPNLPVLPGKAEQMLQVVLNLLMNALLSLNDRSCAVIFTTSFDPATGSVSMCVQDEGVGIPIDIFPTVLEPFFTTWQVHGCMGLGLTVADQIIRNHGGDLFIDSELGKGTNVIVSLPVQ